MTKRIPEVYNDDPTAGNDPSTNYKFPSSADGVTPIAVDMEQVANAVAVRIGTSPPPQPTENLNQFVATIQPNTLWANIQALSGITYTHWVIKSNDATPPAVLPTASSPGDFAEGVMATLHSVAVDPAAPTPADWQSSDTLYPWLYDLPTATLKQLNNVDGSHGTVITPNDTNPPYTIDNPGNNPGELTGFQLALDSVNPSTVLNWTLDAVGDNESGLSNIVIRNAVDDQIFFDTQSTALFGDLPQLTPGAEYQLYAQVLDNALPLPNASVSNAFTITMAGSTAGDGGTIQFAADAYTADEATNVVSPSITRSDDDTNYIQVTVSTLDRVAECIGGTAYTFDTRATPTGDVDATANTIAIAADPWVTADEITHSDDGGSFSTLGLTHGGTYYVRRISAGVFAFYNSASDASTDTGRISLTANGSAEDQVLFDGGGVSYEKLTNQVVSWGAGISGSKTFDIKIIDRAGPFNNVFEIQIDDASNTDGASNPRGAIGATNAALVKIMSSATSSEGFIQDPTSGIICFECTDANSTDILDGTNAFANTAHNTRSSESDYLSPNNTTTYGSASTRDASAPKRQFKVLIDSAYGGVAHDVWIRMFRNLGTQVNVHGDVDNGDLAGLLGFDAPIWTAAPVLPFSAYRWIHKNAAGTDRTWTPATAGQYTFELEQQDYGVRLDKVIIVPASKGYDPSTDTADGTSSNSEDDPFGALTSTYGSGGSGAVDNPDNPLFPGDPPPADTVTPTTLYPANGASNVSIYQTFQLELPLTQVTVSEFTVAAGGNAVAGAFTITDSVVAWKANASLITNTAYAITAKGTGRNAANELKSFDTTGTWTVTTINAGAASTLLYVDFSNRTATPNDDNNPDLEYTRAEAEEDFQVGTVVQDTWRMSGIYIGSDPANTGRENVMRAFKEKDVANRQLMRFRGDFTPTRNVYLAYDLYLPPNHSDVGVIKNPIMIAGTMTQASHNSGGSPDTTIVGEVSFGAYLSMYGPNYWEGKQSVVGPRVMTIYEYSEARVMQDNWLNSRDPTVHQSSRVSNADLIAMPLGRWIRYEVQVDMSVSNGANVADGILKVWLTDPAQWVGAKLVLDREDVLWRSNNTLVPNGIWMSCFYGGSTSDPANRPADDNNHYYDNFIVSTNPITH